MRSRNGLFIPGEELILGTYLREDMYCKFIKYVNKQYAEIIVFAYPEAPGGIVCSDTPLIYLRRFEPEYTRWRNKFYKEFLKITG